MARLVFDGNYKVRWLDAAPANPAAPTAAEWAAGTDLTAFLAKDGFTMNIKNATVTGGDLSTSFSGQNQGTWTADGTITAFMDGVTGGGTAYETLTDFAAGAIIASPFGAPATGDLVYVFPGVELGVRAPMAPAENTQQKFAVAVVATIEPVLDAAMAA